MSFWDLVYYSWFAFLGMAVFSVFGAAIWDSTAAKRRRSKAMEKMAEELAPEEVSEEGEEPAEAVAEAELAETPEEAPDGGLEEMNELKSD